MFRIKMITKTSKYFKKYFLQTRVGVELRPTIDDVDCFLACDSTSLYVGELDGKVIGMACTFKYEDGYRHGSGYYVEDEFRKSGYGLRLFDEVVKKSEPIINRSSYAPFYMIELYNKYFGRGEILYSVETRDFNSITALKKLQGNISIGVLYTVKQASDVDFEALFKYDKVMFGYDRRQFLYKWLYSPASHTCVAVNNEGSVVSYVVARGSVVADEGYKIGPLFCEDINMAKVLLQSVLEQINKQGASTSNSVHISSPIGRNPQVQELLKFLDSELIIELAFFTTNGHPKGCVDKWFAVTSLFCG